MKVLEFKKPETKKVEETAATPAPDASFESIMAANEELRKRKAKERLDANKSVLRSYRIKQ